MGATPLHALPYPELADPADANKGYKDLANAIDPLLLPTTSVVAAATRIVANLLAPTDAQPAFRLMGDGRHDWGAGGAAAPDTSLYRFAANWLATGGTLWAGWNTTPGNGNVSVVAAGDGWPRIALQNNGYIVFGPGTAGTDASLYRLGASQLGTDGLFAATKQVYANFGAANQLQLATDGAIYFGSANDTKLYRSAAGLLKTDGNFAAQQVYVGGSNDTYIFRRSGNVLGTIGSMAIEGAATGWGFQAYASGETYPRAYLRNDGQLLLGPGGATFPDANLYRSGANALKTDGSLSAGAATLAGSGLTLAGDTNLYRVGAGYLKTDGNLIIGGKLRLGAWAAANAGAATIARIPIYDVNETQAGYLHVYDS